MLGLTAIFKTIVDWASFIAEINFVAVLKVRCLRYGLQPSWSLPDLATAIFVLCGHMAKSFLYSFFTVTQFYQINTSLLWHHLTLIISTKSISPNIIRDWIVTHEFWKDTFIPKWIKSTCSLSQLANFLTPSLSKE